MNDAPSVQTGVRQAAVRCVVCGSPLPGVSTTCVRCDADSGKTESPEYRQAKWAIRCAALALAAGIAVFPLFLKWFFLAPAALMSGSALRRVSGLTEPAPCLRRAGYVLVFLSVGSLLLLGAIWFGMIP